METTTSRAALIIKFLETSSSGERVDFAVGFNMVTVWRTDRVEGGKIVDRTFWFCKRGARRDRAFSTAEACAKAVR